MQTPQSSRPSSKGKIGYVVALVGAAISVVSFLALPFISVMGIISLSLLQIENYASQYGSAFGSTLGGSNSSTAGQLSAAILFIWLSLAVAIIACIIGVIFTVRKSSSAIAGAVGLIVLGVIGAGIFLFIIIKVGTAYIAIGGWLCLLGMVAVVVGGLIALLNRPASVIVNSYGYNYDVSQQQPQYPTNTYPQQPQYPQQPSSYPNYPPQTLTQYPQQPPSSPNYPQAPQQPPQW